MKFSVIIPDGLGAELDAVAEYTGCKRVDVVRMALARFCRVTCPVTSGVTPSPARGDGFADDEVAEVLPRHLPRHLAAPPHTPPSQKVREKDPPPYSPAAPTLLERGIDPVALTAELVELINDAAGTRLRPDDPREQRALVGRLTGAGLAPDDAGPATVEQVRQAVEHCARTWTPRYLSLRSILGGPKFWAHHGRASAPARPAAAAAPQLGQAELDILNNAGPDGRPLGGPA